ncbi:unnamed protein product [Mycena citricolor]|uniref:Uncharacterized protein n=2 Tax=Mycena citricolor TaxID=2018698 RepID=A0AAD2Q4X9_9AGAR|nr:unnamed protein product [Mycena citricolor]
MNQIVQPGAFCCSIITCPLVPPRSHCLDLYLNYSEDSMLQQLDPWSGGSANITVN